MIRFIPDIIRDVVKGVDARMQSERSLPVFFDFGHYAEVVKNLAAKDGSITLKEKKYPLVWLVMDFKETMAPKPGIYCQADLHLLIALPTLATYTMEERRDKIFLPKLYPIYEALVEGLQSCPEVVEAPLTQLPHDKWDRPYWGGEEGTGQANLFNDYIDAIQIKNLKLNIKPAKGAQGGISLC